MTLDIEAIKKRRQAALLGTRERVQKSLDDVSPLVAEVERLVEWLRRIEEVTDPAAAWSFSNAAIEGKTYEQFMSSRR